MGPGLRRRLFLSRSHSWVAGAASVLRALLWDGLRIRTIIATANPGCMAQLAAGLRRHRLPGRVVHVVELLDEAYPS